MKWGGGGYGYEEVEVGWGGIGRDKWGCWEGEICGEQSGVRRGS